MPLGAFKAALMGTAGVSKGDVVLLHDTDYSDAATASITSGINSTYGEYIFKFYNIGPATDNVNFTFQGSIDAGSNYNVTMTTVFFWAYLQESDANEGLELHESSSQQQGTAFQKLTHETGSDADQSCAGELHLFNPSSTTYVTNFYSRIQNASRDDKAYDHFTAGYFNSTDNIDAIQFKMSSGNFDGTIKMWGVK